MAHKFQIKNLDAKELDIVIGINEQVPFANYFTGKPNLRDVNIVFFDPGRNNGGKCRLTTIIVEKDGKYQDFYFNGVFKVLSEEWSEVGTQMTPSEWWEEEDQGCECPDWLKEVSDLKLIRSRRNPD